jgi:hypothetical protein
MPPPRARLVLVLLALAALALLWWPRAAGAVLRQHWRWPVHGDVVASFAYSPRRPFAAAQRRGIDVAAPRGAAVRAACGGRVSFAGRVPGGAGLGVTVRCGRLVATHLGLARLAVRRGERVVAGARLGAVGPAGRLRLGARVAGHRFGYVDPLRLLGADPRPAAPRVAPAPPGRVPRPQPRPLGRAPLPRPTAAPRPSSPPRVAAPRPSSRPLGRAPLRHPTAQPLGRVRPSEPDAVPVPSLRSQRPPRVAPTPVPFAPSPRAAARREPDVPRAAWVGLVVLGAGVPLGGVVRRSRQRRAQRPTALEAVGER